MRGPRPGGGDRAPGVRARVVAPARGEVRIRLVDAPVHQHGRSGPDGGVALSPVRRSVQRRRRPAVRRRVIDPSRLVGEAARGGAPSPHDHLGTRPHRRVPRSRRGSAGRAHRLPCPSHGIEGAAVVQQDAGCDRRRAPPPDDHARPRPDRAVKVALRRLPVRGHRRPGVGGRGVLPAGRPTHAPPDQHLRARPDGGVPVAAVGSTGKQVPRSLGAGGPRDLRQDVRSRAGLRRQPGYLGAPLPCVVQTFREEGPDDHLDDPVRVVLQGVEQLAQARRITRLARDPVQLGLELRRQERAAPAPTETLRERQPLRHLRAHRRLGKDVFQRRLWLWVLCRPRPVLPEHRLHAPLPLDPFFHGDGARGHVRAAPTEQKERDCNPWTHPADSIHSPRASRADAHASSHHIELSTTRPRGCPSVPPPQDISVRPWSGKVKPSVVAPSPIRVATAPRARSGTPPACTSPLSIRRSPRGR